MCIPLITHPSAGCSDIAAEVSNAKVVSERSAVKGAPPYNIGSVASIQCSTGYSLKVCNFTN